MKIRIITIALLFCTTSLFAQREAIGFHFGGYDFYGPQTGQYFLADKSHVIFGADNQKNDTSTKKALLLQPLVKVTYWFELSKWFDLNLGLSLADVEYPTATKDSNFIRRQGADWGTRTDRFLGELDGRINFNILPKRKYFVSPYVFAGITGTYHNVFFGADFPAGVGVNAHLRKNKDLYFNLEAGYKSALTSNDFNHLEYTAGLVYWFKPGYRKPKEPTPAEQLAEVLPPPDMDKDGIPDSVDKCPTVPGLPEFNGCPDSDGDGIPDNEDACPLVAGSKQFNGCPDTDGDGIPDNTDKCPYLAGTAEFNGCPPPDRDKDGVFDAVDRCPDVPGTAANFGCPEIKTEIIELVRKSARSVYFETGSAKLKKVSYASLDRVVKVMKDDPSLFIDISGHTDNVGKPQMNEELSDKRANACRDYLVKKGIAEDRITAKGYGEARPIADNTTAIGRAQNRRTEFSLRNYKK